MWTTGKAIAAIVGILIVLFVMPAGIGTMNRQANIETGTRDRGAAAVVAWTEENAGAEEQEAAETKASGTGKIEADGAGRSGTGTAEQGADAANKSAAPAVEPPAGSPGQEAAMADGVEMPAPGGPVHRLVALGDSLTEGIGDLSNKGGYVEALRVALEKDGALRVLATNYGRNGHTTGHLIKRLGSGELDDELRGTDMITISIGGNDLMRVVQAHITHLTMEPFDQEVLRYDERLRAILSAVRALNEAAPVYVLGLFNPFQPWFSDVPEMSLILGSWNQTIERATADYPGAMFVPIDDLFLDPAADLISDNDFFHPNEDGYRLISERIMAIAGTAGDAGEEERH